VFAGTFATKGGTKGLNLRKKQLGDEKYSKKGNKYSGKVYHRYSSPVYCEFAPCYFNVQQKTTKSSSSLNDTPFSQYL
jgi:hypothetical protein